MVRTQQDGSTHTAGLTEPKLAIVIVNFNAWDDVARLVTGLAIAPEVTEGACEIIVVDNASDQPKPSHFPNCGGRVSLVERPDNGGFAAGVNAGWRASRSRWILLLNPDVVAGDALPGQVLTRIQAYEASQRNRPAVVGFRLRNADGSIQPSVGPFPSLPRCLREVFLPRSRRKYQAGSAAETGPVPWVTGACALIDAGLLQALGGLDEDFFLYYEEVALCHSAHRLGRRVEFDPSIEVVHLRPLQNREVSPRLRVITRHSKLLYFQKNLPGSEFLWLARLVSLEGRVRGSWARARGRVEESRAWKLVRRMASDMRSGRNIRGRQVLALAEQVSAPGNARPSSGSVPLRGPHRSVRGPDSQAVVNR
jgi:GT2 family glycosyltransferase